MYIPYRRQFVNPALSQIYNDVKAKVCVRATVVKLENKKISKTNKSTVCSLRQVVVLNSQSLSQLVHADVLILVIALVLIHLGPFVLVNYPILILFSLQTFGGAGGKTMLMIN